MAHANESRLSANYMGIVGLNAVPSARMDQEGVARVGTSSLDPHNHAFIGLQIAKPLYVSLRQSMEVSSIGEKPEMVYPGMDIKLRLKKEGRYAPEIAFGMNSMLGHERFSSEYFALSKRYYDFDMTAGVAWGRLGSAGHVPNPLARIFSRFKDDRDYDSEDASSPSDWFTGEDIGLFGGVEYFTPWEGLSLKADIGADRYPGERRKFDFHEPAPWSLGFNYAPKEWFSFGAAMMGTDKIMARFSVQEKLDRFMGKSYKDPLPEMDNNSFFGHAWSVIKNGGDTTSGLVLAGRPIYTDHDVSQILYLNDYTPSAIQIGRAARKLLRAVRDDTATITVIPVSGNTRGKAITFSRHDLDQAFNRHGSPEEIWQDTDFANPARELDQKGSGKKFKFLPQLDLSFEEETTHLYRASTVVDYRQPLGHGFSFGNAFRLNIADNFHRLSKYKSINLQSVRGNIDQFTQNRINLDRSFLSWIKTPLPDFHLALTAGYLEEMYAGIGGEVLYRPFQSPFAIGAEGWNIYKRDPAAALALGLDPDRSGSFTGHINLYYDIPNTDITAFAQAGRFIAGDLGITGGLQREWDSGMKVKAFVSTTDSNDKDVFNSDRNIYAGLQMSIPIGNLKFMPQGSEVRTNIAPLGRDDAQMLDKPVSLYNLTEPMSYRHLGRNWQKILD